MTDRTERQQAAPANGLTDLAASLLDRLDHRLRAAADPARAAGMAAYMRDRFPFLGLPAPVLRVQTRLALAGLPKPDEADLRAVAEECWRRAEREFQYVACGYLTTHVRVPGPGFLSVTGALITTKSWWDTVDPLATRVVGGLVSRHPGLVTVMDDWSVAEDMWLVRTAILHQLHYGTGTDEERLFGYCARQAGHQVFFVRKAIGWALRQYARTAPEAVREFLAANGERMSGLSIREASKHL